MALWMIRAGSHGEHEQQFLKDQKIYLTWDGLAHDLSEIPDKKGLRKLLEQVYPSFTKAHIANHCGQIWGFSHKMSIGDWFVLPNKGKRVMHIGEITGNYMFHPHAEDPYYHTHAVRWIATDVPRSNFDKDLLYSFGAAMTICQVARNDAEKRVRAMAQNGWKLPLGGKSGEINHDPSDQTETDFAELARDQIASLIMAKFKGHGLARLVNNILTAQGYTTYLSPEGPDKGVDILAGLGPMGFEPPRICVQVKSQESPIDRPTLDQLIGTMANVNATHGLLVCWGGFKTSVDKEEAGKFFSVRLWDQNDLIEQLLKHYDRLDEEIRAELPLKRIWTVARTDEEAS
jgi:restriction system protein